MRDQIAHSVAVHRITEAGLRFDFVSFGYGDLAHIIPKSSDL